VHRGHHALGVVRAGYRQHRGMYFSYRLIFCPEAAGDHDFAVLSERLADRVERFRDRRVDEAARVDDDEVGVAVAWRSDIALGAQLGEDALGIYEGLRAAERNKPYLRTCLRPCRSFDQRGNRERKGRRTCCAPGSASAPGTARTPSGSAPCRPASGSASRGPAGS
jgi:hypothetical protein